MSEELELRGRMLVTKMPIAVPMFAMLYHLLTVRVVSTNGAQRNLRMLGRYGSETIEATPANETPDFVSKNPRVTLIYPCNTPNGRYKNIKTLGWTGLVGSA